MTKEDFWATTAIGDFRAIHWETASGSKGIIEGIVQLSAWDTDSSVALMDDEGHLGHIDFVFIQDVT